MLACSAVVWGLSFILLLNAAEHVSHKKMLHLRHPERCNLLELPKKLAEIRKKRADFIETSWYQFQK
jgi:hypothetical protein